MSLRVVFMGTPQFAVAPLQELATHHEVVAVFTAPDAVRGRGNKKGPSPVKALAESLDLKVYDPPVFDDEVHGVLSALEPDVICVAAYGHVLPDWLLALPRFGTLNIHGSLLPRWRGAAPIERAILSGDEQCGVSIMKVRPALDSGPYCLQRSVGIGQKSADELSAELSSLGAEALLEALDGLEAGSLLWIEQDDALVTYAEKIAKNELALDPAAETAVNLRHIQASSDAHPARGRFGERSVTVVAARALAPQVEALGEGIAIGVLAWRQKMLLAGCVDGAFEVLSLKPDGKSVMDAASFVAGQPELRQGDGVWASLR